MNCRKIFGIYDSEIILKRVVRINRNKSSAEDRLKQRPTAGYVVEICKRGSALNVSNTQYWDTEHTWCMYRSLNIHDKSYFILYKLDHHVYVLSCIVLV